MKQRMLLTTLCALAMGLPGRVFAQSAAEKALLAKAQSLEAHGHLDLAVQTWRQILLSDPAAREALLGIAKADMQLGNTEEAQQYTQRLRDLGASTADLAQIAAMPHVQAPPVRLAEARRLAQQGRSGDAMKIYRDLFPHGPPGGDMALEYYETEAAIPETRREATDRLRELSIQFSADARYAIVLGRILTYDPKTRAQGIAMLSRFDSSPEAQQAIKQAEGWNNQARTQAAAANAASTNQSAPREPSADPLEGSAYRALNSGRLDEAEQQFATLLAKQPHNPKALSGMGYVDMKRGKFPEAADYLEKARAAGASNVATSIATSRFWSLMAQAASEQKAGDTQSATKGYREALALKPGNRDAEEALAGVLMQSGNGADAVAILKRQVVASPDNDAAWRNLFLTQARMADWREALATVQRIPRSTESHLESDPEYLRFLIQGYVATKRKQDADRTTELALSLPFPNHGRDLPLDKQLQYAALLITVKRYEPALRLYRQVLEVDSENAGAWRALIAAEHQLGRDDEALAAVRGMSRAAYDEGQNDAGFLALLGSIYQSRNQLANAAKCFEKAVSIAGSSQPGIEMQLADVYIAQGEQQKAYAIYRGELDRNPNSVDAWRGLLSALHQTNHDRDALREIAAMPASVQGALEQDPAYLQTLASIESANGQDRAALQTFESLMQAYVNRQTEQPVDARVQYGWLLLKAGDDRRLYGVISQLAQTSDLTDAQQTNVNKLWASWSVRRANTALAAGEKQRGISILEAAAQAFPQDADVLNTLAGAYLQAGQAKRAVAVYASLDLRSATLAQYQGAIGAALAAHDLKQAEAWLQAALELYKNDPPLLRMAAQYEQTRGDSRRAAAYYRAAIEAMGPESPAEMFSHADSGRTPQDPVNGRNTPAQDLMRLLAPSSEKDQVRDEPSSGRLAREADVSWRDGPRAESSTLADFWPSERVSSTDKLPPSGSLGDLTAAEDTAEMAPPSSAPIKRIALVLPPRGTYADEQDAATAEQSPTRRAKSRSSNPAPAVPATRDSEGADNLRDAVKDMEAPPRSHVNAPFAVRPKPLDRDDSDYGQAKPLATEVAPSPLPPLTGAFVAAQAPRTPREQIQQQLADLEGASSNWIGGTSTVDYRSGQPGYDRLAVFSGQAETSTTLGPGIRTTFIVKPVLLDAGQATGTDTIQQGTLPLTSTPYVQSAAGTSAEFQLQTANFGGRAGTTPRGFLIQNFTAGLSIHPASGHFNIDLSRDPILDTQLSFAGLRDQGSKTASFVGNTWGGVIANSGEVQVHAGDALSGWYIQAGGQYLTGLHVATNKRLDGDGGAYWTAWHSPEYGSLIVGMNFFGMHYQRNLRYFTYGQGGYFSPGAYLLAGAPLTFNGHYGTRLHYRISGSLGMQAFQEDSAPYFPLDAAYQAAQGNPAYPERTSVGGNYNLETETSYAIADHWYVGAYTGFNNSRNYASDKVGFFVRFVSRPQPSNEEAGPTGLFPTQGMRPLRTP